MLSNMDKGERAETLGHVVNSFIAAEGKEEKISNSSFSKRNP
jgi:hypothetical protein